MSDLPFGSKCPVLCHQCSSSHDISIFVDALKITMKLLQKTAFECVPSIPEDCSWSSVCLSVPPGERWEWLRARLEEIIKTCQHLLVNGERLFIV